MTISIHTKATPVVPPQPGDQATINGHPTLPWFGDGEDAGMITVCAHCGEMRTIIMLVRDRWYCSACRASGYARDAKAFPISWNKPRR